MPRQRPERRRRIRTVGSMLLVFAMGAAAEAYQSASDWDARTEAELARLGLDTVLAAQLEHRFESTQDQDIRVEIAEDLASVYSRLLDDPESSIPADEIRRRSKLLLQAVPGEATVGLRLTLAVARYSSAESDAERERFAALDPAERERLAQELASLRTEFAATAQDLDRRVDTLERRKRGFARRGRIFDPAALEDAHRFRSLSSYFAAWSGYYLARLTGDASFASSAIEDFGRLLDSPDDTPTLDRLPLALLKFDAVARSAIGVALSYAISGNIELALGWVETLQETSTFPDSLQSELDSRTVQILLESRRWTDLRQAITRLDRDHLALAEWQLLANESLSATENLALTPARIEAARALAQQALRHLIATGQLGAVLEIARAHPNLPLDGAGFAIKYVKGVEAYEQARRAHESTGEPIDEPTAIPRVATLYQAATRQLLSALQAGDAATFANEQVACAHLAGQASFAAGRLDQAAELLERAADLAPTNAHAEPPLWLAIAVQDRLARAGESAAIAKRNQLASRYLARYPDSDRAGLLLLRLVSEELVEPARAIAILSEVPPDAPHAEAAQQHLATLLYSRWNRTRNPERQTLASQFLTLSSRLLEADAQALRERTEETDPVRTQRRLVLTARRALDVAITGDPANPLHASSTLALLSTLEEQLGLDLTTSQPEMLYRKLQLALLNNDIDTAEQLLETLRVRTGPFADSAERVVYSDALARLAEQPNNVPLLQRALRVGGYVLAQLDNQDNVSTAALAGVLNSMAEAAAQLWQITRDSTARDRAIELDSRAMQAELANYEALERLAALAEQSDRFELAAQAWLRLMATTRAPDSVWFLARANSIRLLVFTDPARAIAAIQQHRVLYPSLGPPAAAQMILAAAESLDHTFDPPLTSLGSESAGGAP